MKIFIGTERNFVKERIVSQKIVEDFKAQIVSQKVLEDFKDQIVSQKILKD